MKRRPTEKVKISYQKETPCVSPGQTSYKRYCIIINRDAKYKETNERNERSKEMEIK